MKLADLLLEKSSYVIDKKDLVFLSHALDKYEKGASDECFLNALVQAIKIATDGQVKLLMSDLEEILANDHGIVPTLHYVDVKKKLKKNVVTTHDMNKVHLDLKLKTVKHPSEVIPFLKQGIPVIISININDAFWDSYGAVVGWRTELMIRSTLSKYGDTLPKSYYKKLKAGIIPYPTVEMMDRVTKAGTDIFHAILCVGYDAKDKAFICRDNLTKEHRVKFSGLFKVEEQFFWDTELKKRNLAVVRHGLAVDVVVSHAEGPSDRVKERLENVRAKYDDVFPPFFIELTRHMVKLYRDEVREKLVKADWSNIKDEIHNYLNDNSAGEARYQLASKVTKHFNVEGFEMEVRKNIDRHLYAMRDAIEFARKERSFFNRILTDIDAYLDKLDVNALVQHVLDRPKPETKPESKPSSEPQIFDSST